MPDFVEESCDCVGNLQIRELLYSIAYVCVFMNELLVSVDTSVSKEYEAEE